jgi:hypothetical protein
MEVPIMAGLFTPLTDKPRKLADMAADRIDPRMRDTHKEMQERPFDVINRALIAGLLQGVGNEISGLTSPAGLAAVGLPALRAGRLTSLMRSRIPKPITSAPHVPTPAPNVISTPDMVPIGGENLYNIIRMSERGRDMKKIKDVAEKAEDAYRTTRGGVRPGLGDVDVVEMMQKVAAARGR